jgi:hypothetical protein
MVSTYWWSLSIKSDHQLSDKKGEISKLVTYAFTINQVPHVFGDYYFAGHKHKYMEDFTNRRFPNTNLRKRIRETPTKTFQIG